MSATRDDNLANPAKRPFDDEQHEPKRQTSESKFLERLIPDYIFIYRDNKIKYSFSNKVDAEKFVDGIKSLLVANSSFSAFWVLTNNQLKSDEVNVDVSIADLPAGSQFDAILTADQFDTCFGQGSYTHLIKIEECSHEAETLSAAATRLTYLNTPLANHAALLREPMDEWTGFNVAADQLNSVDFIDFINKLTPGVCDQVALQIDSTGWTGLHTAADKQSPDAFMAFLNRLSDEVICKSALLRNERGESVLGMVALKQDSAAYTAFLDRISDDACKEFVLGRDNDGHLEFTDVIQSWRYDEVLKLLNRLSNDTCEKLALMQETNGTTTTSAFMYVANSSHLAFESFVARLSPSVCDQAALQVDQEDGHCGLWKVAEDQPRDLFMSFYRRLSEDTINKALLQVDKARNSLFMFLLNYLGDSDMNEYINKISPEVLAALILSDTNYLTRLCENHQGAFCVMMSRVFQHPAAVQAITARYPQLESIQFYDGGGSKDTWSSIARLIINQSLPPKKRDIYRDLSADLSRGKHDRSMWTRDFLNSANKHGVEFWRLQGRTILLKDKDNQVIAVKVQKLAETHEDLIREYDTTRYLKEHAAELNLQSSLPDALSVTQITRLFNWLETRISQEELAKFKKMVANRSFHNVYVYKVDLNQGDYFIYLHDPHLSEAEFTKANQVAIHDLFSLFTHGVIFPQLADIFHNSEHVNDRDDAGRYQVFVNLLRGLNSGSGRLTGWKEAVEYPNVRASGIADLGDRASFNDFITKSEIIKKYYSASQLIHGDKAGNFILANVIGEYQYVLFLIAGRRGSELTEQIRAKGLPEAEADQQIKAVWDSLAKQVMTNAAHAVSIITHQKESEVLAQLSALVEVDRLARQMPYFMTTKYVHDVASNKIRDDIYGDRVDVTVSISYFRGGTFNNTIGCSIDGVHQDLGPVNGQEPIKEANKLFYWTASLIFNAEHQFRHVLDCVQRVANTSDLTQSEKMRATLFSHLPRQQFHTLQAELCEERLTQKAPLPKDVKEAVTQELMEHKRELAAYTFGDFWRRRQNNKQPVTTVDPMEVDPSFGLSKR